MSFPINCKIYKKQYPRFSALPLSKEIWDTAEFDNWISHSHECISCQDWALEQELKTRGVDISSYPCVHMAYQATYKCEIHPEPNDCPDILVLYFAKFDEYSLPVRDGGSSVTGIRYCPWCGVKLPQSKRDRWFLELEALGISNPAEQEIPEKYLTNEWFKNAEPGKP